jgi:hypothetical protein
MIPAQRRAPSWLVPKCISDRAKAQPQWWGHVEMYTRDVVIHRKLVGSGVAIGGPRGFVTGLSRAAARRLLLSARNVTGLRVLVTLTYPATFPTDGRRVKRDWSAMRKWLARRAVGGLWFLEFQERGAPHIHAFLTGPVSKESVAAAWYQIVRSGDIKHLRAGTRIEALRSVNACGAYASKYAAKQSQKVVPVEFRSVGRFWGLFGGLRLQRVEVVGHLIQVSGSIRVARRGYEAARRSIGRRGIKDRGRWGFTAWNMGPMMKRYLYAVVEEGANASPARSSWAGYQVRRGVTRLRAPGAL